MQYTSKHINRTEIDYQQSIKKQRLEFKKIGSNTIVNYALCLLIIIITVYSIFQYEIGNQTYSSALGVYLFVIIWLSVNLSLNNALIKIHGKNVAENKTDIIKTLDALYISHNLIINKNRIMTSFEFYAPVWNREITLLFDENIMYLNITTIGRTHSPTWIHGLYNFIKAKRIARYYKSHFNN